MASVVMRNPGKSGKTNIAERKPARLAMTHWRAGAGRRIVDYVMQNRKRLAWARQCHCEILPPGGASLSAASLGLS
ncbi:MAG TPA: hypothetical protein VG841_02575 [Caulobacterales bacterium]|nr:hypothetical protein [Caulobacterales bacterium]